jgi:hypothetical protein
MEASEVFGAGVAAPESSVGSSNENATGVVDVALAEEPEALVMKEPFTSWA